MIYLVLYSFELSGLGGTAKVFTEKSHAEAYVAWQTVEYPNAKHVIVEIESPFADALYEAAGVCS